MAEKTRRPSTPRQEVLDRERNETYKTETNVDCQSVMVSYFAALTRPPYSSTSNSVACAWRST